MKLSEKVRQQIGSSPTIIAKISEATGRTFQTIERWIEKNDEMLTMAKCLHVIYKELGLTEAEVLESEVKA